MREVRIAAIVLTKDEEQDLPGCLESLQGVADEVYVVDSGSRDGTIEVAKRFGATVLEHPFVNHADQLNWAIENAGTTAEWLLRIDADERVDGELGRSLKLIARNAEANISGIELALRTVFLGKRLRHGGTFPLWLLRMWRRGEGICEERWMDEHMVLRQGKSVRANGELIHLIPKSLEKWSMKHVWYAKRECQDVRSEGPASSKGLCGQAADRRRMKNGVYYRLPPVFRAFCYWGFRYFGQLGFLDGKVGFVYHFLQGLWYRVLIDVMLLEGEQRRRPEAGGTKG